jgi:hypothetical protein
VRTRPEPEEEAARRYESAQSALWDRLCACRPESRADAISAALKGGEYRWLEELFYRLRGGLWRPVPIPEAVVDAFLADPEAEPLCYCDGCGTVLPYRGGFWRKNGHPNFSTFCKVNVTRVFS